MPSPASAIDHEVCVVCVQFQDLVANASLANLSTRYFTGEQSFVAYWRENSGGRLNLSGEIAVDAWVTLPEPLAEFGADGPGDALVDQKNGVISRIVYQTIARVDAEIDFTRFDSNADGTVDHFVIIHAGAGQEEDPTQADRIWSHACSVSVMTGDGVVVGHYALIAESTPIGILCHEVGHLLGLPDLYDLRYETDGIGNWGLMAFGGWQDVPAHLCAWSKVALGWASVTPFQQASGTRVTLAPVESRGEIVKLVVSDTRYFLLEYRQAGDDGIQFDADLPGSGLLVWLVDERGGWSAPNQLPAPDIHLVEADANGELEEFGGFLGEATDPWTRAPLGCTPVHAGETTGTPWWIHNITTGGGRVSFELHSHRAHEVSTALDLPGMTQFLPAGDTLKCQARVRNLGTGDLADLAYEFELLRQEANSPNFTRVTRETGVIARVPGGETSSVPFAVNCSHSAVHVAIFRVNNSPGFPEDDVAIRRVQVVEPQGGFLETHDGEHDTVASAWNATSTPTNAYLGWFLQESSTTSRPETGGTFNEWQWGLFPAAAADHGYCQTPHEMVLEHASWITLPASPASPAIPTPAAAPCPWLLLNASYCLPARSLGRPRNNTVFLQWSTDGIAWHTIHAFAGVQPTWALHGFGLGALQGSTFKLRFVGALTDFNPEFFFRFDEILVASVAPPEHGVVAVVAPPVQVVTPGAEIAGTVVVFNAGSALVNVTVEVANDPQNETTGGAGAGEVRRFRVGRAAWDHEVLAPGALAYIPVTYLVPRDLPAGSRGAGRLLVRDNRTGVALPLALEGVGAPPAIPGYPSGSLLVASLASLGTVAVLRAWRSGGKRKREALARKSRKERERKN